MVNAKNPRQIALSVLQARRQNGEYTEALLDRALIPAPSAPMPGDDPAGKLQTHNLSPADRALCQELVYGIVRAQSALDWLISRKTAGREQNSRLQDVLRLGLYQIFWLDRIPPHAAVHETVELAKREGLGPKAGFVNAVLRGYLREFDATKKILGDLKNIDPAVAFSHPQWLVEKWRKQFGAGCAQELLEWNNSPPETFARVNTLKTSAGILLEKWREENVEYDFVRRDFLKGPDLETLIFELKSHPPLASLASFRNGWFYLQDPSTLLAPLELAPQPGESILDLCAAPGGKATLIAQLMHDTGTIMASDISRERLKLLAENCARLGVNSIHPSESSMLETDGSKFDRIIVDAPCSNTGVLRRRVDLRWRLSSAELLRLQQVQLELLKLAAPRLRQGGTIIYSTCSLEPEENSVVVRAFMREHEQFTLDRERQLLPFKDHLDGAYVARMIRSN